MSASYRLVRNPNPKKDGETQPLHPRFVPSYTVSTTEILDKIKNFSSFSSADLAGMLQLLKDTLADYLRSGVNVRIDGLGTFSVSLESRPVMEKTEIRAESIFFKDVKFTTAKEFKKRLAGMPVTRLPEMEKKTYTLEECEERMMWYINKYGFITGAKYRGINNCCKTKAAAQLKQFRTEKKILRKGKGPTTFYVLPPQEASQEAPPEKE
jgi:predicted histone-like DNA-binding protein